MVASPVTFDTKWNDNYDNGQANRYPFDCVVSFLYTYYPRNKERKEVRVLEVGCGTGNNLWFAAREGFSVFGIDGSTTAIDYANRRFKDEGLAGEFRVGDFTERLPVDDASIDLVIDRNAITHTSKSGGRRAVEEVARVLAPGGHLFFNPFSDMDSGYASGTAGPDGTRIGLTHGSLATVGQVSYYGRQDMEALFDQRWKWLALRQITIDDCLTPLVDVRAEWQAVLRRA